MKKLENFNSCSSFCVCTGNYFSQPCYQLDKNNIQGAADEIHEVTSLAPAPANNGTGPVNAALVQVK